MSSEQTIELTLPINAAYISAARLTSSSIANRLGFGIEEIEDIKTAVSEACTFIIEKLSGSSKNPFKLKFKPNKNCVSIIFEVDANINFEFVNNETSILMIKALMDEMKVDSKNNGFVMSITKNHKVVSFD